MPHSQCKTETLTREKKNLHLGEKTGKYPHLKDVGVTSISFNSHQAHNGILRQDLTSALVSELKIFVVTSRWPPFSTALQ